MAYGPHTPISIKVDASVNNIPTAFSTAAGSRVLTGLGGYPHQAYTHLMVINETAGRICVATAVLGDGTPSGSTSAKLYVLASGTATFDGILILDNIYIQSDTGSTISTGTVEVQVW